MRERECGRRRGAMTKNSGSLGSWSCTHSRNYASHSSRDSHMSWLMAWRVGHGTWKHCGLLHVSARCPRARGGRQTADGRQQTADGRRPRPRPSASSAMGRSRLAARVSQLDARRPVGVAQKVPSRDRSGVITPHQSRPARNSLQKPRCFFFFCPLSPPVLERGH